MQIRLHLSPAHSWAVSFHGLKVRSEGAAPPASGLPSPQAEHSVSRQPTPFSASQLCHRLLLLGTCSPGSSSQLCLQDCPGMELLPTPPLPAHVGSRPSHADPLPQCLSEPKTSPTLAVILIGARAQVIQKPLRDKDWISSMYVLSWPTLLYNCCSSSICWENA